MPLGSCQLNRAEDQCLIPTNRMAIENPQYILLKLENKQTNK